MRVKRLILSTIIASASICAFSQKGLDAPMTKAVMNVYQQLLEEDPTDYETYYRRACEYYKHNQYNLALSDINNALKYTPAGQKQLRIEQLILRANIYEFQDKLQTALDDLNAAYKLDPYSYIVAYQRGNIEYQLGMYIEAKADYKRMQNINNRSAEALIGLARIAVKENNLGLAREYADQVVSMYPSESSSYVRRASIRSMMDDDSGAVEDLLLALSTDNNTKALQELVKLSDKNYSAVMTGLSNAIRQAPKVGMFYYIRAVIAESHYKYKAAMSDYKKILYENLYNYYGLYHSLATCTYALGNYDSALDNVNYAIIEAPKNLSYNITKAKITRALGDTSSALEAIDKVLTKEPNNNEALTVKALTLIDNKEYERASAIIGEALINDGENPELLMLKAWILETYLEEANNAKTYYDRILELNDRENSATSLKGFALLFTGQIENANVWIESIIENAINGDGSAEYLGTCFYARSGDLDKAFECMETALEKGYANYHNWTQNTDGKINVEPLRNDKRFAELLSKYSIIFN